MKTKVIAIYKPKLKNATDVLRSAISVSRAQIKEMRKTLEYLEKNAKPNLIDGQISDIKRFLFTQHFETISTNVAIISEKLKATDLIIGHMSISSNSSTRSTDAIYVKRQAFYVHYGNIGQYISDIDEIMENNANIDSYDDFEQVALYDIDNLAEQIDLLELSFDALYADLFK